MLRYFMMAGAPRFLTLVSTAAAAMVRHVQLRDEVNGQIETYLIGDSFTLDAAP